MMIARIAVSSKPGSCVSPAADPVAPAVGISPGAIAVGVVVVETAPQVGISPASAETERMHVKAMAKVKRFIGLTPYLGRIM
jgi:hypothetical protein